jgi:hypothetical protein
MIWMLWQDRVKGLADAKDLVYKMLSEEFMLSSEGREILIHVYWHLVQAYILECATND